MPDWKQIVRRNLRVLAVCPPEFTEELAAHLEVSYEASPVLNPAAYDHRSVGCWVVNQHSSGRGVSFTHETRSPIVRAKWTIWKFTRVHKGRPESSKH